MTAYLITALPWIVGGAYLLTLILVLRARQYWAFPAYLAAEFISLCLDAPNNLWVVFYLDPIVLVLQVAAAVEACVYVTWCVPGFGERVKILLTAIAVGAVGAVGMMYQWNPDHLKIPGWFGAWPESPFLLHANQAKLTVHVVALAIALVPVVWEATHPARKTIAGARAHAWTLALYLFAFTVANSYFASGGMEYWEQARTMFRLAILPCLVLWCLQAVAVNRRSTRHAP